MGKELLFNIDAQLKIKTGIDKLAKAVGLTMGPKGRNVIIEKPDSLPHITKDGVTVARNINFNDQYENIGAQLVKEVAIKTAEEAGDGTTTSTILASAIYNEGIDALKNTRANPILLKRYLDKYVKDISKFIKDNSISVDGDFSKVESIATISANNDKEMGTLIAKAVKLATSDGLILVEEGNSFETELVKLEGIQLDNGYESHYFINNTAKKICEFENPYILIYGNKLYKLQEILHILEACHREDRPLVIIANEFDPEILNNLIANKVQGALKVCAIKAPEFGENRISVMKDLAIMTGGTYVEPSTLKSIGAKDLGTCKKFQSSQYKSTIIGGNGNSMEIEMRKAEIKADMTTVDIQQFALENLKKRLAKLSGGIVIIKVGALSKLELKEKTDRLDDALCATRAAMEEGYVPGAGSLYYKASEKIQFESSSQTESQMAVKILKKVLKLPLQTICSNAGLELTQSMLNDISTKEHFGINLMTDEVCNLIEAGIIDPAKVERVALENAVSIASLFLTTGCIIIDKNT